MKHPVFHNRIRAVLAAVLAACLCACGAEPAAPAETQAVPSALPEPTVGIAPAPVETATPAVAEASVLISEVMSHNKAVLPDSAGHFHDWIELHNVSGRPVSLQGWRLSDGAGKPGWELPARSLAADEYLLIFADSGVDCAGELLADFSVSDGETLFLLDSEGTERCRFVCPALDDDCSAVLLEGGAAPSSFATPGYENSDAGYRAWQDSLSAPGPITINEVVVSCIGHSDWIEVKNLGHDKINLEGYYLSDTLKDLHKWPFPSWNVRGGMTEVFYCEDDEARVSVGFSLDAQSDQLYLSNEEGLLECIPLRGIPSGGSIGRMDGEGGLFYFAKPSKNSENSKGERLISVTPGSDLPGGVYDGVEALSLTLQGEGDIYYTTDASLPTVKSARYTGPLSIDRTCVVRAICVQEGRLPSPALTLSFILNEGHTLPVLSLVTDDQSQFRTMYSNLNKSMETPGSLSFYEPDGSFTIPCGISLSGNKSLNLWKKSLKINFRSHYGADSLDYDLFDAPVTSFRSLNIRAGHDYQGTVFRNELWQDISLAASDKVYAQHSRFCVMYLNGQYYGVYALKENLSRAMVASREGLDRDSIESVKLTGGTHDSFYKEVVQTCMTRDLRDEAVYAQICDKIDLDSFVDYYLIQGFCGNNDLATNVRVFRSAENGLKWRLAFYDLDFAMRSTEHSFTNIMGSLDFDGNDELRMVYRNLLRNEDFRTRLLERFAELYGTVLSDRTILEGMDRYTALLSAELPRDRERWNESLDAWYLNLAESRALIEQDGWQQAALENFCRCLKVTDEERARYFGSP